MAPQSKEIKTQGELTPEGAFVIRLRSGSDPAGRTISGRVEHVMSGRSQQFPSLEGLLAFMTLWTAPAEPSADGANQEESTDRPSGTRDQGVPNDPHNRTKRRIS